ncbi:hypothetical protein D9758_002257 [Tetrapyrgos nigripes]|uniref:Uncharacterized protein n=1 Tax=Tetrapyrgos nigripes TaxID=182062 RepID=A0A8H5LTA2_9AGAR|nr:hypothetical protein D9758_002257 [Tetrapyrgos nigripes]
MNYSGHPHHHRSRTAHAQPYPNPTHQNLQRDGEYLFPPTSRKPPLVARHEFHKDQFCPEYNLARMNRGSPNPHEDAEMQRLVQLQARSRERTKSSGASSLASQSSGYSVQRPGAYSRPRNSSPSALPVYPHSNQYCPEVHTGNRLPETPVDTRSHNFELPSRHINARDSLFLPYTQSLPRCSSSSSSSSRKEPPTLQLQLTRPNKSSARSTDAVPVSGLPFSVSSGRSATSSRNKTTYHDRPF